MPKNAAVDGGGAVVCINVSDNKVMGDTGFEPVTSTDHSYRKELTGLDVAAYRAL